MMTPARCVLRIEGLDCPTEAATLRQAMAGANGVAGLEFDTDRATMTVTYDPDATSPETLVRRVADRAGMIATQVPEDRPLPVIERPGLRKWWGLAASGIGLALGVVLGLTGAPRALAVASFVTAIIAGGATIIPKAVAAVRSGRLDMHVLMAIAIVGAAALGQWDEAATVAFLFTLSEAIEGFTLERARRAVRSLLEIAPETAERIAPDGSTAVVAARELQPGDRVRVRAGMRVPIDGVIAEGRSSIDQRAITGESVPVSRGPGDSVYAGTVNGEGSLEITATKPLDGAVVTRVVEQVRAAQAGRTPLEQVIERFAAVYTPVVVALALLVMVIPPLVLGPTAAPWPRWFMRGLVVLVTGCPCALVISTPVAVVSALTAAARRGVLVKSGQYLEAFGRLKVLAFDKTGTLTLGSPEVVEVVPTAGRAGPDLIRIAAALGDRGGHVLGRAIARHARDLRIEVPEAEAYQAVPGMGATGQVESTRYHIGSHRYLDETGMCRDGFHDSLGVAERAVGTAVALSNSNGPLGWIRLADRPRPEARGVLAELHGLGLKTIMLTGDNPPTADAMARELGIDEARAGLLPEEKASAIQELERRLGPTGMVGDGVNDAPALAASRVSVALGGISSAVAIEAADIVLMADDLTGLPWLARHSRRTVARIRQNIAIAVGSKALVLVLAIAGHANLWLAIAADLGVSLLVVMNALRLLRTR